MCAEYFSFWWLSFLTQIKSLRLHMDKCALAALCPSDHAIWPFTRIICTLESHTVVITYHSPPVTTDVQFFPNVFAETLQLNRKDCACKDMLGRVTSIFDRFCTHSDSCFPKECTNGQMDKAYTTNQYSHQKYLARMVRFRLIVLLKTHIFDECVFFRACRLFCDRISC